MSGLQPSLATTASPATLPDRVHAQVHKTWKLEHRLKHTRTSYAHKTTRHALIRWEEHHRLWAKRNRDVRWVIRAVFPRNEWATALCVTWHESHWQNSADNPTSSAAGPWQFLNTWYAGQFNPYDPWQSTKRAWRQVRDDGWSPWYPDCGIA